MDFEIAKAIPMLQATPKVVTAMLEGLDEVWINTHYGPWGEFLTFVTR